MRFVLALIAIGGCGDDDAAPADAAVDAAADAEMPRELVIAPPAPPIAPTAECPQRWQRIERGEREVCVPFLERASCTGATRQAAGDEGCTPIGAACPSGDFPDDAPADARFVRPGASGTGTRASPYGTIEAALVGATSGTTIMLARGEYEESVGRIPAGVEIRGACVAETRVVGRGIEESAVLSTNARDVSIRDLTVGPTILTGIRAGVGGVLTVTNVLVDRATASGLLAENGGSIAGTSIVVRGTQADDEANGVGVLAQDRGQLALTSSTIEDATLLGAVATDRSTLSLTDVTVAATRPSAGGRGGGGVVVQLGSIGTLDRVLVAKVRFVGLFVASAQVTASDLVVRDTLPDVASGDGGRAIDVSAGATLTVNRGALFDVRELGTLVSDPETIATLRDVTIDRVEPIELGFGDGIAARRGGRLELERVSIAGANESAMLFTGEGTTGRLVDLSVRETSPRPDGIGGRALDVQLGASVELERAAFIENHETSIAVGLSTLTASDLLVRGTRPRPNDDGAGRAITVQEQASVTLERARFEEHRDVSLLVLDEGTRFDGLDVEIESTVEQACAQTTCASDSAGIGVSVALDATASLEGFRILDSTLCGLQLAEGGDIVLTRGEVRRSAVGVCLQVDGFAIDRLMNDVHYGENGSNLDATSLPVPSALAPISSLAE